jgi:hypothetical protein
MDRGQIKIKKESDSTMLSCCSDGDHYPYGTSLGFDDEMVDDLGLSALAVGDMVEVRGYAFVDNKSENSNKEGSSKSIRLQLTSVEIKRKSDEDVISKLYGE